MAKKKIPIKMYNEYAPKVVERVYSETKKLGYTPERADDWCWEEEGLRQEAFRLKEAPLFLFGLWVDIWEGEGKYEYIRIQLFAQAEKWIDKFKPSRSPLMVDEGDYILQETDKKYLFANEEWSKFSGFRKLVKFIVEHPYLAWVRDVEMVNFNLEYISEDEAKQHCDDEIKQLELRESCMAEMDEKLKAFIEDYWRPEAGKMVWKGHNDLHQDWVLWCEALDGQEGYPEPPKSYFKAIEKIQKRVEAKWKEKGLDSALLLWPRVQEVPRFVKEIKS